MNPLVITVPGRRSMLSAILVSLILFVSFRVLLKCPLDSIGELIESLSIFICFSYGIFYLFKKLLVTKKLNVLDVGLIFIYLIPFYSAFMSFIQFDQPIIYGILAQRKTFLVISCVFIYQLMRENKLTLGDIERGFLLAVWIELIMNFLFYFLISPQDYLATSYINVNNSKGGITYGFDVLLLIGGTLYYWIKTIKQNTFKYLPFVLIFLGYIFFIQKGRGLFIALTFTMLIVFLFQAERNKKIIYSMIFFLSLIFGILILNLSSSELLEPLSKSYTNVLDVLIGNSTGEASADSRIIQVNSVMEYFGSDLSKIFFGSGKLSNQWESGFKGQFEYLYPSDIGVIGVIFVYGIIGFLMFKLPYLLVIRLYRKYKRLNMQNTFLTMLFYFLLYIFIHSIQTGEDTFDFQKNAVIIIIIYAVLSKKLDLSNKTSLKSETESA